MPSRVTPALVALSSLLPVGLFAAPPDIATEARSVLERHCYVCHGKDGVQESGLHVLDWSGLTADGRAENSADAPVVPGQPRSSNLLRRMRDGSMPPDPEFDNRSRTVPQPDAAAIATIERWIRGGAPSFEEPIDREFISPESMLKYIADDLRERVRDRDRRFIRYFTLTHLYNAGVRDDEIATYRLGLSKLINSLSWARDIARPTPVDPHETIFRIDVRDYDWGASIRDASSNRAVWDLLVDASPYNIAYPDSADYHYVASQVVHDVPFIRGDWFVFAASQPPLYHDILEIPPAD